MVAKFFFFEPGDLEVGRSVKAAVFKGRVATGVERGQGVAVYLRYDSLNMRRSAQTIGFEIRRQYKIEVTMEPAAIGPQFLSIPGSARPLRL